MLVAVTGSLLTGFVIVHLIGNLKLFEGRDAINAYAAMLKSNPAVLWGMRGALLGVFLIHLVLALRLKLRAMAARPVGYAYPNTIQASWPSRLMPLTGLMILLFVIFHIAHHWHRSHRGGVNAPRSQGWGRPATFMRWSSPVSRRRGFRCCTSSRSIADAARARYQQRVSNARPQRNQQMFMPFLDSRVLIFSATAS